MSKIDEPKAMELAPIAEAMVFFEAEASKNDSSRRTLCLRVFVFHYHKGSDCYITYPLPDGHYVRSSDKNQLQAISSFL